MPKRNNNFIPPLSLDINDTGSRHMVGRHRKMMAERFGVGRDEYPKGVAAQRQFMKFLKEDNPEKYNKYFDIIVRGLDPEPEREVIVDIPSEMKEKIDNHINKATQTIMDQARSEEKTIERYIESQKDGILKEIKDIVEREAKVVNKTETVITVKKEGGKAKKLDGKIVPEDFQKIIDLASQRINILLIGPSGCGKSHLSKIVSESLDLEFASQSCSAGMSESAFSGWLLPIGAAGKFEYVSSEFVRIYENGGVFLFDEIDAADSNTMLFLNQALANGEFYLPQRHKKPKVTRHKDFVCIAAANTFGHGATALYSGRNIMDGATMDRFRMGIVPMDYSSAVEDKLVDPEILEWGRLIREVIRTKSLRKILSTRLLIEATKMNSVGWTLDQIEESYFADWSKEERRMIETDFNYGEFKGKYHFGGE